MRAALPTTIRPASFRDARAVAYLLADSFHPPEEQGWWGWTQPWLRSGMVQDIEQRLTRQASSYACLVALVRDKTVGTIEIAQRNIPGDWWRQSPTGQTPLYLSNLAVDPAWRRQGIARALLNEAETLARQWRHAAMYLHVMTDNPAACKLYEQLGYQVEKIDRKWPLFQNQPTHKALLSKLLT